MVGLHKLCPLIAKTQAGLSVLSRQIDAYLNGISTKQRDSDLARIESARQRNARPSGAFRIFVEYRSDSAFQGRKKSASPAQAIPTLETIERTGL